MTSRFPVRRDAARRAEEGGGDWPCSRYTQARSLMPAPGTTPGFGVGPSASSTPEETPACRLLRASGARRPKRPQCPAPWSVMVMRSPLREASLAQQPGCRPPHRHSRAAASFAGHQPPRPWGTRAPAERRSKTNVLARCRRHTRSLARASQAPDLALARETQNGGGGIRTLGTVSGPPAFKTGAFDHSATHPGRRRSG